MVGPLELRARVLLPFVGLASAIGGAALGYWHLGQGRWAFGDCLYMAIITLTTVGYSELPGMADVPYARGFTMAYIVTAIGLFLYFASNVTAVIIEGDLRRVLVRQRKRRQIAKMKNHYIVCGVGSTGRNVVHELLRARRHVLGIDTRRELLEDFAAAVDDEHFHFLSGDATDDAILADAGVERAAGLVAALPDDKDNVYLVVTARAANADARIIARGSEKQVLAKLRKVGADQAVSPNVIGGHRMVHELLRPHVVRFLEDILGEAEDVVIEEIPVVEGSALAGRSLREVDVRRQFDVGVLAVRDAEGAYTYNPSADHEVRVAHTLVVLGSAARVDELRRRAAG